MRKFDSLLERTLSQLDEAIPGQTAAPAAPAAPAAQAPAATPNQTAGKPSAPAAQAPAAPTEQGDETDAILQWAAELPPEQGKKYAGLVGDAKLTAMYKDFKADPKNAGQKPAAPAAGQPPTPAAGQPSAPAATPVQKV